MKWIRVEDRVPDHSERVLVLHPGNRVEIEHYYPVVIEGFSYDSLYGKATHWMPLPVTTGQDTEVYRWLQDDKWRVRCPVCGEVRPDTEPRKYCPECGVRLEVAE